MTDAMDERPHRAGRPADADASRNSLLELTTLLLRRRRLLLGVPILAAISAVAFSFLLPERYTVEARFIPETERPEVSRVAGLAAQFGVDLPGMQGGQSVDFYAELLSSRELLRSAALTEYRFADDGDTLSGNMVELLDAKGETPERRLRDAVEKLDELVVARVDPQADMVIVETSAPWPALAVDLSQRLLDLISEFNLDRRQSRAAAERTFLEQRVEQARQEMRSAETELERFMSENRQYTQSPQLQFEAGRLQRNVDLHQQIYSSLAAGYEQARVDEVRNTPVITVIDPPHPPAEQTAPNYVLNAALGLVLGGLLAFGWVIGQELLRGARTRNPEQFAELEAATRESLDDVRPGRLLDRLRGRGNGGRPGPATGSADARPEGVDAPGRGAE